MFSFRLQDLLSSKPVFIYNQYTIKSLLKRTLRILLSRNPVHQKLISVPYKVRVKVGDIFTAQYFNTRQAASEREPLPGEKSLNIVESKCGLGLNYKPCVKI